MFESGAKLNQTKPTKQQTNKTKTKTKTKTKKKKQKQKQQKTKPNTKTKIFGQQPFTLTKRSYFYPGLGR